MNFAQPVTFLEHSSFAEQSKSLAETVAQLLQDGIESNGIAKLAVSGGSTPLTFFQHLSKKTIDWSKVEIFLVDDRWVAPHHADSNQQLVEQHLLQYQAQKASFTPLYSEGENPVTRADTLNQSIDLANHPIDVLLLGMGNDGHTASIFPCSEQIEQGLCTQDNFLAVTPSSAPHQRLSMSAHCISRAKHRFLQLKGDDKKETLARALQSDNAIEMPIRHFLAQPLTISWTPSP